MAATKKTKSTLTTKIIKIGLIVISFIGLIFYYPKIKEKVKTLMPKKDSQTPKETIKTSTDVNPNIHVITTPHDTTGTPFNPNPLMPPLQSTSNSSFTPCNC